MHEEVKKIYDKALLLKPIKEDYDNISIKQNDLYRELRKTEENKDVLFFLSAIAQLEGVRGLSRSFGASCSIKWLNMLTEIDFLEAYYFLGLVYAGYYEFDQDKEKAIFYFNTYKEKGGTLEPPKKIKKFFKKLAKQKDINDKKRHKEFQKARQEEYNYYVANGKVGMDPDVKKDIIMGESNKLKK